MEKDGTYIVASVMVGVKNGTYGASGVVWCHLIFFFLVEVFGGLFVWVKV